jgi:ABC-type branched-subunit amino acid transport system substrate-binding protein
VTASANTTRRAVLKASGTAGVAALAGCTGDLGGGDSEHPPLGNYPIDGDTATYGFNVPQTGPYQQEGADELRAYHLAVDHLNNGGGWVDLWDDLSGDGVNGYEIDFVEGDTETDADAARDRGERMIQRDDVIMFSGGSSSATAIAQQTLAQREKVMFMCCLTHSNDTTGQDCVRYSFREVFNAYMTGQAMAPIVVDDYGSDLDFYQLYADYTWGQTQQESMRIFFEEEGWSEIDSVPTPLGTDDYSPFLSEARDADPDVLFLNHYGLDLANSLRQAVDEGLRDEMEIVVPLYNEPMAGAAGDAIEDIYGTSDWSAELDDEFSQVFIEEYRDEYDRRPSEVARLAYTATMLYSAAVERAGTFYPPEVIRELEDYEYDNAGLGEEIMRKCDHQAMRDVLVVQGLSAEEQEEKGRFFDIVEKSPYPDNVGYECGEGPASECELGEYGDE